MAVPLGAQEALAPAALTERTIARVQDHLAAVGAMVPRLPGEDVTGAMMAYDPAQDTAGAADGGRYGKGDRAWVETALGVYDLYRLLGGEIPGSRQLFARQSNRFYVGNERGAGAWFDSPEAALAHYFALLARASRSIAPGAQPTGSVPDLATLSQRLTTGVAAAQTSSGAILLPVGAEMRISMPDADTVIATPGLMITETRDGPVVSADGSASGRLQVYGYRDGRRFGPASTLTVTVPDTASASTAPAPDPSIRDGGALVPGGRSEATLVRGGGGHRYALTLEGGAATITSDGSADVTARLLDANGVEVAGDDDGGEGYNFRLEADLPQGTYTLVVEHCCLGGGRYGVSVTQDK